MVEPEGLNCGDASNVKGSRGSLGTSEPKASSNTHAREFCRLTDWALFTVIREPSCTRGGDDAASSLTCSSSFSGRLVFERDTSGTQVGRRCIPQP